jgi:hypothetical protein
MLALKVFVQCRVLRRRICIHFEAKWSIWMSGLLLYSVMTVSNRK